MFKKSKVQKTDSVQRHKPIQMHEMKAMSGAPEPLEDDWFKVPQKPVEEEPVEEKPVEVEKPDEEAVAQIKQKRTSVTGPAGRVVQDDQLEKLVDGFSDTDMENLLEFKAIEHNGKFYKYEDPQSSALLEYEENPDEVIVTGAQKLSDLNGLVMGRLENLLPDIQKVVGGDSSKVIEDLTSGKRVKLGDKFYELDGAGSPEIKLSSEQSEGRAFLQTAYLTQTNGIFIDEVADALKEDELNSLLEGNRVLIGGKYLEIGADGMKLYAAAKQSEGNTSEELAAAEAEKLKVIDTDQKKTGAEQMSDADKLKKDKKRGKELAGQFGTEFTGNMHDQLKQSSDARKSLYAALAKEGYTDLDPNLAAFLPTNVEDAKKFIDNYKKQDSSNSARRDQLNAMKQEILDFKFNPTDMTGTEMRTKAAQLVDMNYKLQAFPKLMRDNPWFEKELPFDEKEKLRMALDMQESFTRSLMSFLYMNGVDANGGIVTEKRLVQIAVMMNEQNITMYVGQSQNRVGELRNLPERANALTRYLARYRVTPEITAEAEVKTGISRTELLNMHADAAGKNADAAYQTYIKASGKTEDELVEAKKKDLGEDKGASYTKEQFKSDWLKTFTEERGKEEQEYDKALSDAKRRLAEGKATDDDKKLLREDKEKGPQVIISGEVQKEAPDPSRDTVVIPQHKEPYTEEEMKKLEDKPVTERMDRFSSEAASDEFMQKIATLASPELAVDDITKNIADMQKLFDDQEKLVGTSREDCTKENATLTEDQRVKNAEKFVEETAKLNIIKTNLESMHLRVEKGLHPVQQPPQEKPLDEVSPDKVKEK